MEQIINSKDIVNLKKIDKSRKIYCSILNKINHKPLIFDNIFNYAGNRPFMIYNFLEKELILKEKIKDIINGNSK